ncbi:MAG TPA: hypothetical protein EYN52_06370, partial [Alphaproteobacteria bacterium]|nr:hypothetical protein [Alphaproteobacteria bacterium]
MGDDPRDSVTLGSVAGVIYDQVSSNHGAPGAFFPSAIVDVSAISTSLTYDPGLAYSQDENCYWWKNRAERDESNDIAATALSSSVNVSQFTDAAGTNTDRAKIFEARTQVLNRGYTTPYRFAVSQNKVIHGGVNYAANKDRDFLQQALYPFGPKYALGGLKNVILSISEDFVAARDCDDVLVPNKKKKYTFAATAGRDFDQPYFGTAKGDIFSPFNLVSSSVDSGYSATVVSGFSQNQNLEVVNLHSDTYGDDKEIPMQGPFTQHWVGGHQSRHVNLNRVSSSGGFENYTEDFYGLNNPRNRPEAWRIFINRGLGGKVDPINGALGFVGADYPVPGDGLTSHPVGAANWGLTGSAVYHARMRPRATLFREELAKRPVNIKNIQTTTGSAVHGNYRHNYEVINTTGRSLNDPFFNDQSHSFSVYPESLIGYERQLPGVQRATNIHAVWQGGQSESALFSGITAPSNADQTSWDSTAAAASLSEWNTALAGKKITVSAWIYKQQDGGGSLGRILSIGNGSNLEFDIYTDGDEEVRVQAECGSNDLDNRTENSAMSLNTWHHLVVTWDGNASTPETATVYVDGVVKALQSSYNTARSGWTAGSFTETGLILGNNDDKNRQFYGYFGDVAVWDTVLGPGEVKSLYNGGYPPDIRAIASQGLVSWWRMGDGAGDANHNGRGRIKDQINTHHLWGINDDGGETTIGRNAITLERHFIAGSQNFALPERTGTDSNHSVIVNRFSAPGGFETLSRGFLDPAHEEYSSNNALPFRNLSVLGSGSGDSDSMRVLDHLGQRRGLRTLRTLRSGQHGIDPNIAEGTSGGGVSGSYPAVAGKTVAHAYSPYPSWHKTNRNRLARYKQDEFDHQEAKSVLFDNGASSGNTNNDYIDIGNNATWTPLVGGAGGLAKAFSVSVWVNIDTSPGTSAARFAWGFGSAERTMQYTYGSGNENFRLVIAGSTAGYVDTTTNSATKGVWHHVVCTFAGGDPGGSNTANYMKIYLNGVLDSTVAQELNNPSELSAGDGDDGGQIGARPGSNPHNYMWDGYVDEMSVWDKALTAAEVSELYNNGVPTAVDFTHSSRDNIISYWPIGGGSDTYNGTPGIYDVVGTNHGTPHNLASNAVSTTALTKASIPTYTTDNRYDNAFVTHQIPQSDMQYAWITASATSGPIGYETSSAAIKGASNDITFVDSRSDVNTMTTGSITFDGLTDAVFIGTHAYWEGKIGGAGTAAKAFTLSAWIKAAGTEPADAYPTVFVFGQNNDRALYIYDDGADAFTTYRMNFRVTGTPSGNLRSTDGAMTAGRWHHVVATYSGGTASTMNLYIDGVLDNAEALGTSPVPVAIDTEDCFLGSQNNSTYNYEGDISNAAVWDKALTAAEVAELHNGGAPFDYRTHTAASNLVSWWKLGDVRDVLDGTNETAADATNVIYAMTGSNAWASAGLMALSQINRAAPSLPHNYDTYYGVSSSTNTLYYGVGDRPAGYSKLHSNDAYGWVPWKQLRGAQHPVARDMRKNNRISIMHERRYVNQSTGYAKSFTRHYSFTEPPISYNQPIEAYYEVLDEKGKEHIVRLRYSYENNLVQFANYSLNRLTGIEDRTRVQIGDKLADLFDGDLSEGSIQKLIRISSTEVIYPSDPNVGLGTTRARTQFDISWWSNYRGDEASIPFGQKTRNITSQPEAGQIGIDAVSEDKINSFGYSIASGSRWPLDARFGFSSPHSSQYGSASAVASASGSWHAATQGNVASMGMGEGELQNNYTLFVQSGSSAVDGAKGPIPGCVYARRVPSGSSGGVISTVGDTLWEAASQSGKYPSYTTYDAYAASFRMNTKEYSIIPEFKVSDHMPYYIDKKQGNFLARLGSDGGTFNITGAAIADSTQSDFYKTYSHSDFLKSFTVIRDQNEDVLEPEAITLRCHAIKKLLPYEGFYPVQRTLQLARLYTDSYIDSVAATNPILTASKFNLPYGKGIEGSGYDPALVRGATLPLFAPGVLYNSIKAGLACDYPVFAGNWARGHDSASAPIPGAIDHHTNAPFAGPGALEQNGIISASVFNDAAPSRTDATPYVFKNRDVAITANSKYADFTNTHVDGRAQETVTGQMGSEVLGVPYAGLASSNLASFTNRERWSASMWLKLDSRGGGSNARPFQLSDERNVYIQSTGWTSRNGAPQLQDALKFWIETDDTTSSGGGDMEHLAILLAVTGTGNFHHGGSSITSGCDTDNSRNTWGHYVINFDSGGLTARPWTSTAIGSGSLSGGENVPITPSTDEASNAGNYAWKERCVTFGGAAQMWLNSVSGSFLENHSTNAKALETIETIGTHGFCIGNRMVQGHNRAFDGGIDEFVFFNECLTQNEIEALYNDGEPPNLYAEDISGLGEAATATLKGKVLRYWQMGDATSGSANGKPDGIADGITPDHGSTDLKGYYYIRDVAPQVNEANWPGLHATPGVGRNGSTAVKPLDLYVVYDENFSFKDHNESILPDKGAVPEADRDGTDNVAYPTSGYDFVANNNKSLYSIWTTTPKTSDMFDYRFPFESLVEPEKSFAAAGNININFFDPHPQSMYQVSSSHLLAAGGTDGISYLQRGKGSVSPRMNASKLQGSPKYKLAMHNFLAETIDFFIKDDLTGFVSRPEEQFEPLVAGYTYKMRVNLNKNSITQYDRPSAFGPPCMAYDGTARSFGTFGDDLITRPTFSPFTPPYFDTEDNATTFAVNDLTGESFTEERLQPCYAEITITPTESRRYSLNEIFASASVTSTRDIYSSASVEGHLLNSGYNRYDAMPLSASVNLFSVARMKAVEYEAETGRPLTVTDINKEFNIWSIETKFETPMLDFAAVSVTHPKWGGHTDNTTGSYTSKGMWHQYGNLPTGSQGVFLGIQDVPGYKSLANVVGFAGGSKRIGEVAEEKILREAVVAIPFVQKRGR